MSDSVPDGWEVKELGDVAKVIDPHPSHRAPTENKKGIPFVQGIFNMGGTGVIPFCGKQSIQLIITKRNPKLLPASAYDKDKLWSFTVIRRRAPSKSRSSSVIEYLAPINVSGRELNDTLTFSADSIPALPKAYDKRAKSTAEHAYSKPMSYGTCIKLYEYQIGPRKAKEEQSHSGIDVVIR